ncbi:MAG: glycosyltransferase, partial [Anaerolineaceae bacterium]|nr:glycosyltransferase [Anaerolineaceae bacterium]
LMDKYNLSTNDFIFIFVARFRKEKRHDLAIAGMEKAYLANKNIKIVFVGDGPTIEHSKKLCLSSVNPEMFVFAGNQRSVREYLALSHCFMLCSDAESFSIATLEAMAMGLPIISSDVGGQSEMIKKGVNGMLFDPGNVDDLAQCIKSIASNPDRAKKMGNKSKKIFNENFTSGKMLDKYSMLFESLSK